MWTCRTRDEGISGAIWHPSCLFTVVSMAYPIKTVILYQKGLHSSLLAFTQHSGRVFFSRQVLGSNKYRHGFDGSTRYFTIEVSSWLFKAFSRRKISSANTKKLPSLVGGMDLMRLFPDSMTAFFTLVNPISHNGVARATEHTA